MTITYHTFNYPIPAWHMPSVRIKIQPTAAVHYTLQGTKVEVLSVSVGLNVLPYLTRLQELADNIKDAAINNATVCDTGDGGNYKREQNW